MEEIFLSQEPNLLEEKRNLKKSFNNSFLYELSLILEKCFAIPKKKKEHFITIDRLEVDFLKLLQSQKQFTSLKNVKDDLKALAVFDKDESIIGKIMSIDLINETVEFQDMYKVFKTKPFEKVTFFDFNTLQCLTIFEKQKLVCDKFTYQDAYRFLMSKENIEKKSNNCISYKLESILPSKVI